MNAEWRWDFAYEILPKMLWATLNTIMAAGIGYSIAVIVGLIFLIGQQTVQEDGIERQQRVIHIDLDHPRVSHNDGEALFFPYGGNTPLLDEVGEMLEAIHHGLSDSNRFIDVLIEHELLESFTLDLELDNGQKHQMIGFYTINENTLAALPAEVLGTLHQQGYLQAIYMALASQSKVRELLNLKNAQG